MRLVFALICTTVLLVNPAISQDWKKLLGGAKDLSEVDASAGIKEALVQGVSKGTDIVSQLDGYYGNPEIKIPIPSEAENVDKTLRRLGMGDKMDEAIKSMNRAAEDAAMAAKPIFINAIERMTIEDGVGLVKGGETSGTDYLRGKTTGELHTAFKPSIQTSLDKVDATKYWDDVMNAYNKVPFVKKVNPDLADYVTGKAIEGLFHMIAKEETAIRNDPAARTTELLEKVFK